jgi:hypothetical protein
MLASAGRPADLRLVAHDLAPAPTRPSPDVVAEPVAAEGLEQGEYGQAGEGGGDPA